MLHEDLELFGFAIVDRLVPDSDLVGLRDEVDELLAAALGGGGVRNVLGKSAKLCELATAGAPARLAEELLGPAARPIKLTVFDKTPQANWKVPWHQDLTIAVTHRQEVEGFGPWSVKDGVPHVQPPVSILGNILAIRLHLDDTPPTNGALRVLPGTHRLGRLSESKIASLRRELTETLCAVPAGAAMLMSPLLLHASSLAVTPGRRRVLHFEYSAVQLPGGLSWA
ncbi:MAG TPA: phytanoyl-CoA dioxygenase family protein [Thermoanaerobaculia bacterium]|jgi:hypothetical protein|nr:phytanoyl-CoA dioxygenase family protein [Thermoanaerobaculia bacterium]